MVFEQFVQERNLSKETRRRYKTILKKYALFNDMSLEELLDEADKEEINGVRWKNRKLKTRLIEFRKYLYNSLRSSTAKMYFISVVSFYRHFEIEIHKLPSTSNVNVHSPEPVEFSDIPTKELLQKVINESKNNTFRTVIYFMSSTGLAMIDTLNLTVKDFLTSCNVESIDELDNLSEYVSTFKLKRRKTGKYFYTFATPETTKQIINYIHSKPNVNVGDKLFDISADYLYQLFRKTNDRLGKGRKNNQSLFRSHMLRKYHATTLLNSGLTLEQIDALQGRSKEITHQSYFLDDPKVLKEIYMEHMDKLTIFGDSEEIHELKEKNRKYKEKFVEQEELIKEIVEAQEKLEKLLEL